MNNPIILVAGIYALYVLIHTIMHNDIFLKTANNLLNQSQKEMRITVLETEKKVVSQLVRDNLLHPTQGSDDRAMEAIGRLEEMKRNEEFLDELVDEFIRDLNLISTIKRIKNFFWIMIRDLYTLTPIILLLFTGSIQLSIIISFVLMFSFSMFEEHMLRLGISDIYGEEVSDNIMSSFSAKINIVTTAIVRQSHFYITLLILLNK